jgi:hypothetical protein
MGNLIKNKFFDIDFKLNEIINEDTQLYFKIKLL